MRDFVQSFTARLKTTYRVGGQQHSFTVRYNEAGTGTTPATVAGKVGAFLDTFASQRFSSWNAVKMEYAAANSDVFLPVSMPSMLASTATDVGTNRSALANFWQFIGRGEAGSKVSFYIYGLATLIETNAISGDYRITSVEATAVSDAIGALSELAPNFLAIDGSIAHWYEYVNVKANDHWVHKIRNGA